MPDVCQGVGVRRARDGRRGRARDEQADQVEGHVQDSDGVEWIGAIC